MRTMKEKLLVLLKNIRDLKYTLEGKNLEGKGLEDLPKEIAKDLDTSPEEAKTILGYLFKNGYAQIDAKKGLILIYNEKTRKILDDLDSLLQYVGNK